VNNVAAIDVRRRAKDSLARFLGWFSVALGVGEAVAPRAMARLIGADPDGRAPLVIRAMGARELAQGVGILVRPRPTGWLWARVAGDGLDLSLLGLVLARRRRRRTLAAIANVAAITVPDVFEALHLARKQGPPSGGTRIRKAVTINLPRADVERAWESALELRRKLEEAGADVELAHAPGDRGTELHVDFVHEPPAGDLGAAVEKLTGRDLATQLSDDLRRFKQRVETGEVVRSDGAPDGHLLAEHLMQRAARPLEEAVR
jgi:hypothetical protein